MKVIVPIAYQKGQKHNSNEKKKLHFLLTYFNQNSNDNLTIFLINGEFVLCKY